jgi:hypothetical protein
MEPLNENELNELLRQWQAPGAPPSLAAKVLPQRSSWWRWMLMGTIRIPVPLGIALLVALAVVLYFRPVNRPEAAQPGKSVSLADFQPVKQLEPRIIRRGNETN